ncbi:MAG TPA: hypothetical protein VJJ52_05045 [Candidatus Nanoarchaeia archaeon]|nr:hypothetical protein [Candidatus Nanoarchaeia archaeon]
MVVDVNIPGRLTKLDPREFKIESGDLYLDFGQNLSPAGRVLLLFNENFIAELTKLFEKDVGRLREHMGGKIYSLSPRDLLMQILQRKKISIVIEHGLF